MSTSRRRQTETARKIQNKPQNAEPLTRLFAERHQSSLVTRTCP